SASYQLNDSWSVYGIGRYTRLGDEIKDSPMVDKSWAGVFSTGVTYSF
ncbi:MipA/OmpV family protein, partial [Escherichia coli]